MLPYFKATENIDKAKERPKSIDKIKLRNNDLFNKDF